MLSQLTFLLDRVLLSDFVGGIEYVHLMVIIGVSVRCG